MAGATKGEIVKSIKAVLERWDELPNQGHLDVNIHEARVILEGLLETDDE